MDKIRSSEITPEHFFVSRRKFLAGMGIAAAWAVVLSSCKGIAETTPVPSPTSSAVATPADKLTPIEDVTGYNNFYEFSLSKTEVAAVSQGFKTSPWTVAVGGLVNKPQTFGIEDLVKKFPPEERVYRLRCVEAWSMVIPWLGFPLGDLLKRVEPTSRARFVEFTTLLD